MTTQQTNIKVTTCNPTSLPAAFEPGQRLEVEGKINNVENNFVVDTGATVSIINADLRNIKRYTTLPDDYDTNSNIKFDINPNLKKSQKSKLVFLLQKYDSVFSKYKWNFTAGSLQNVVQNIGC